MELLFFRQMLVIKLNKYFALGDGRHSALRCFSTCKSFKLLKSLLKLIICCSKSFRNHQLILNVKPVNSFLMTESFKVASLKDVQLTLHQGHFIEKLDLGDAFFKCPFSITPAGVVLGQQGKKITPVKGNAFHFPLALELNGTPKTSCLVFELWQLKTVNHYRQQRSYIMFINHFSSSNAWQAQRNYINHFFFMWLKKFLKKCLLSNRIALSGK